MDEINSYMQKFSDFLDYCDLKLFITIDEIMNSGFFDDITEVNVFFISLNGVDYMTYVNADIYLRNLPQVQNNTTDLF